MNLEEKVKRINELYHKSKKEGLTAEELEEQKRLRRDYIDSFKANVKSQLDNIDMQQEDGTVVNLGEKNASVGEFGGH